MKKIKWMNFFISFLSASFLVTTSSFNEKNNLSINKISLHANTETKKNVDYEETKNVENEFIKNLNYLKEKNDNFLGHLGNDKFKFSEYYLEGDVTNIRNKFTNIDFDINVYSKPIINTNLNSKDIENNSNYEIIFKNWNQQNNINLKLSDFNKDQSKKFKNYFNVVDVIKAKTTKGSLYNTNYFNYKFKTNSNYKFPVKQIIKNKNEFEEDIIVRNIRNDKERFKTLSFSSVRYNGSLLSYYLNDKMNNSFYKIKKIFINDKEIDSKKINWHRVGFNYYANRPYHKHFKYYPKFYQHNWGPIVTSEIEGYKYFIDFGDQYKHVELGDMPNYPKDIFIKFVYESSSFAESIRINPNSILDNNRLNRILNFQTFNSYKLNKLIKLNLNDENRYLNNGNIFNKAPELNFSINDKYFKPAYELFELKKILTEIDKKLLDKNTSLSMFNNLEILKNNILKLNSRLSDYKKDFREIIELNKNILKNDDKILDFFQNFNIEQEISTDYKNWDEAWFSFILLFKNIDIKIKYDTPIKKDITQKIWDKTKFIPIKALNNSDQNNNYIKIKSIEIEANNNIENEVIKNLNISYDNSFKNIKKEKDDKGNVISILYRFNFRENALNFQNGKTNLKNQNNEHIEIDIKKYVLEILNSDQTEFLDEKEILNSLNSVFTSETNLFSSISFLNIKDLGFYKNLEEALSYFEISRSLNENFTNNDEGVFYAIATIDKWRFKNDNDNINGSGDFSKKFIEEFKSNINIFELIPNDQIKNEGYFLIKLKSKKTETKLKNNYKSVFWKNKNLKNFEKNDDIFKDKNNPLLFLNTQDNKIRIENFLENKNNLKFEIQNINDNEKIKKYFYDENKNISLEINDGFNGIFTNNENEEDDKLDQIFLKKLYESDLNFSFTDNPKFVQKLNNGTYTLNNLYELKINKISGYEFNANLVNRNEKKLTYNISLIELKSLFDKAYLNDFSNFKNTYLSFINLYNEKLNTINKEVKPEKINKNPVKKQKNLKKIENKEDEENEEFLDEQQNLNNNTKSTKNKSVSFINQNQIDQKTIIGISIGAFLTVIICFISYLFIKNKQYKWNYKVKVRPIEVDENYYINEPILKIKNKQTKKLDFNDAKNDLLKNPENK